MNDKITLRTASPSDAEALLKIYSYYAEETAISFETEAPTAEEFKRRIEKTLKNYPYIIAEQNGEILGYSYTSPFVGRAAYIHAAETTIYIKKDAVKKGIGKKLYKAVERISEAQNIYTLEACIGTVDRGGEDERLTNNSAEFHSHMGYRFVGEFKKCGRKFGKWYNMIWMEKVLREHPENPEPFVPFPELAFPESFLKEEGE